MKLSSDKGPEKWKPELSDPRPARLYIACAYGDSRELDVMRRRIKSEFGTIDFEAETDLTDPVPSLYSHNDRERMHIVSPGRPVGREELVDVRKRCLALEYRYQEYGVPKVELDPGYITEFSAVRTSLEDDFHRVYLYGGVFAEAFLYFEEFTFRPFLHSPEFFRNTEVLALFNDLRLIYTTP